MARYNPPNYIKLNSVDAYWLEKIKQTPYALRGFVLSDFVPIGEVSHTGILAISQHLDKDQFAIAMAYRSLRGEEFE